MRSLALLALAFGCQASDPCAGQKSACLAVNVEGSSGISKVDTLSLHLTGGAIDSTKTSSHGAGASLPVQVGLVVDSLTATTAFDLAVDGLLGGSLEGSGSGHTELAPGQHRSMTVTLRPGSQADGGGDAGGDGGDQGGVAQLVADHDSYDFGAILAGAASGTAVFKFTNQGGDATGTLQTMLGGASASAFAVDTDGCVNQLLAPGASCSVSLHLAPSSAGSPMATLTVSGMPGGSAQVIIKAAVLEAGDLLVTPAMHPFDPILAGTTGADFSFTVSNIGGAQTGMLSLKLSGTDGGEFAISSDNCSGNALMPAGTCTLAAHFAPTSPGGKTASLQVIGIPGGIGIATLSGNALGPAQLSGPSLSDFSSVVVGLTSAVASVDISNSGGTPSGMLAVSITGANSGDFAIANDGCTGVSLLQASTPCTIKLTFAPTQSGMRLATLHVTASPGGSADVALQGNGLAPAAITPSPPSFDFMTVEVGSTSTAQQFNITNTGDTTTGMLSISLAGTNSDEFLTMSDTCTNHTLAKNGNCAIQVAFKPKSYGSKSASLQVMGNPGGLTSASLAGFGMDQQALTVVLAGPGGGTVAAPGLTCSGGSCSGSYDRNSMVTLTAQPDGSSLFNGWSISACGTNPTCQVTMSAPMTVTASFVPATLPLTVSNSFGGTATGSVSAVTPSGFSCSTASCMHSYAYNTTVTLSASAGSGSTFTGWSGDCTGVGNCIVTMNQAHNVSAAFANQNVVFVLNVAASPQPGQLGTYDPVHNDGLVGGDNLCNQAAAAATPPLAGHFVAYLSREASSTLGGTAINAVDRLVRASDGGPVNGWVRPDGKPVFASKADLIANKMLYPIHLDQNGVNLIGVANAAVATGTNIDGTLFSGSTCGGWGTPGVTSSTSCFGGLFSRQSAGGSVVKFGMDFSWSSYNPCGCTMPQYLYCFQVDSDAPLAPLTGSGRVAFVAPFTQSTHGISDADAACATAATGHLSGNFLALVAGNGTSANRFTGGVPWSRPDGVFVVASATDLFLPSPTLQASIDVAADGTYLGSVNVWTGSTDANTAGVAGTTCNGWTNNTSSFTAYYGLANATKINWFDSGTRSCALTGFYVYCLQQ